MSKKMGRFRSGFARSVPEHATWDDIMYEFYVKKKIVTALKAADDGRVVSHADVKKRFSTQSPL